VAVAVAAVETETGTFSGTRTGSSGGNGGIAELQRESLADAADATEVYRAPDDDLSDIDSSMNWDMD
jgi:hypothetical protein